MRSTTHSLTSAVDGGEWSATRPGCFTRREIVPGTHWIGGWVGTRAVLDAMPGLEHPIIQPIAQRYTGDKFFFF
jgi:hypothetical protein